MGRRCHHQNDANLYKIFIKSQQFKMANYSISKQLQIDNNNNCNSVPFESSIALLWNLSFCQSPIKKLAILIQFKQSVIECIDKHRIKESESEKKEESESDDLNDFNDFNESDEDLISLCDSISSDEEIQKNDLRNK